MRLKGLRKVVGNIGLQETFEDVPLHNAGLDRDFLQAGFDSGRLQMVLEDSFLRSVTFKRILEDAS